MADVHTPQLRTTGTMALELGAAIHRVQHILATRPHIRPIATAGGMRLWDSEAVAMVRHELAAIDARHGEREAARTENGGAA
jgi:hypothetical protein